jgi:hypothetical protein
MLDSRFRNLKDDSISSWTDLRNVFLRYWGENKSFEQYLSKFYALKKERYETVTHFNKRFHSFYLNMHVVIRPFETIAMVLYTATHLHPDLVLYLRERNSLSLEQMFVHAEEIEDNLRACGRLPNQVLNEYLQVEEHEKGYEQYRSNMVSLFFPCDGASSSNSYFSPDLTISKLDSSIIWDDHTSKFCEDNFAKGDCTYSYCRESFIDHDGNVLIPDGKLLHDQFDEKQVVVLKCSVVDSEDQQTSFVYDHIKDYMFSNFGQESLLQGGSQQFEEYFLNCSVEPAIFQVDDHDQLACVFQTPIEVLKKNCYY